MDAAPCDRTEEEQARRRGYKHLVRRRPEPHCAMEVSNQSPGQPDYEVKADLHAEKPKKDCGEARVQKTVANSRPRSRSEHKRRKQNVIPEFIAETPKRPVRAEYGRGDALQKEEIRKEDRTRRAQRDTRRVILIQTTVVKIGRLRNSHPDLVPDSAKNQCWEQDQLQSRQTVDEIH